MTDKRKAFGKPKRSKAPIPTLDDTRDNLEKPVEDVVNLQVEKDEKPKLIKSLKQVQRIVEKEGHFEAHPKGLAGCKAFSVNLPPEVIREINMLKVERGYRYMNELALEAFAAYLTQNGSKKS